MMCAWRRLSVKSSTHQSEMRARRVPGIAHRVAESHYTAAFHGWKQKQLPKWHEITRIKGRPVKKKPAYSEVVAAAIRGVSRIESAAS